MAAQGAATSKPDAEEWLREAEAAYGNVTSHTAVFHKQQRVAGKLLPEETIFLKSDNLRPVTSTGIGYLLEIVAINVRKAVRSGELEFSERGTETVYGRNTRVLHMAFPQDPGEDQGL